MTTTTCTACGATFPRGTTICTICGTTAVPVGAASGSSTAEPAALPSGTHGSTRSSHGEQDRSGWSAERDASAGHDTGATSGPGHHSASPPPPPHQGTGAYPNSEQRGWSIGAHLAGLGAGLATAATLGFVGPLVIYLLRKDEDPFTEHHSKEALNFHLTVLVAVVAFGLLVIPGVIIGILTLGLGFLIGGLVVAAAAVAWLVLPIIGTVKASNGEGFRYPLTIRFVR